jgi:hypothetical protein
VCDSLVIMLTKLQTERPMNWASIAVWGSGIRPSVRRTFPHGQISRGVRLLIFLHVVLRLRMHGAVPSLLHTSVCLIKYKDNFTYAFKGNVTKTITSAGIYQYKTSATSHVCKCTDGSRNIRGENISVE